MTPKLLCRTMGETGQREVQRPPISSSTMESLLLKPQQFLNQTYASDSMEVFGRCLKGERFRMIVLQAD